MICEGIPFVETTQKTQTARSISHNQVRATSFLNSIWTCEYVPFRSYLLVTDESKTQAIKQTARVLMISRNQVRAPSVPNPRVVPFGVMITLTSMSFQRYQGYDNMNFVDECRA